ncbi:type II toxin-antitoxin system HicB family antitoxin [Candidatus Peregrinibacteria bacterium]|nr:type II toxin-antitoxin system HicB family antitoxin [Candidatus Peregrinibacteria bacterium]
MKKINGQYQFEVIFTPQKEGGFTAEVPDLQGCISEGDTLEKAEKNIREAIELYYEYMQKMPSRF